MAYRKTLGKGLGLGVVTANPYLQIEGFALPHIKEILDCVVFRDEYIADRFVNEMFII